MGNGRASQGCSPFASWSARMYSSTKWIWMDDGDENGNGKTNFGALQLEHVYGYVLRVLRGQIKSTAITFG